MSQWGQVTALLQKKFPTEASDQSNKLNKVLAALQKDSTTKGPQLVDAMARALTSEPKWIVFCLGLSALGGILALTAAVLHAVKQVNQLHASQSDDDAPAEPSPPSETSVIHIDHYTPMLLAFMSLMRWPHSIYSRDWKMFAFQLVNVLVWSSITVYVWVNDPHPSLPHIDL